MVRVVGFGLLLTFLGSCIESHSCTEIGCADAAGVIIRTESGEWPAGVYTLDVSFDSQVYVCSFTMPDDLPEMAGQGAALDCDDPALYAYFSPRVTCTETSNGNSVSQSCTPIENQFDLQVSMYGTPAELSVELKRDDSVLVEESHTLTYEEYFPNGPECGPACRQADVNIAIP